MKQTRGIRNNNPCNIRKSRIVWQGEVNMLNGVTDKSFCQFKEMVWGLRATFTLLKTYRGKYRIRTIQRIIERWAPPGDGNNTEAYIAFVEKESGIHRHAILSPKDYMKVVKAMCKMESNYTPVGNDLTKAFYMVFD